MISFKPFGFNGPLITPPYYERICTRTWIYVFYTNVIWLCLEFVVWFGTYRDSDQFQIRRKIVNPNRLRLILNKNQKNIFCAHYRLNVHTEKSFRNLVKSNWNQIVFTISRMIWNQRTSVWFQVNRCMVNTIWFQFDLTRFRKDFSVCSVYTVHSPIT